MAAYTAEGIPGLQIPAFLVAELCPEAEVTIPNEAAFRPAVLSDVLYKDVKYDIVMLRLNCKSGYSMTAGSKLSVFDKRYLDRVIV
jgi:hypothetical protein